MQNGQKGKKKEEKDLNDRERHTEKREKTDNADGMELGQGQGRRFLRVNIAHLPAIFATRQGASHIEMCPRGLEARSKISRVAVEEQERNGEEERKQRKLTRFFLASFF